MPDEIVNDNLEVGNDNNQNVERLHEIVWPIAEREVQIERRVNPETGDEEWHAINPNGFIEQGRGLEEQIRFNPLPDPMPNFDNGEVGVGDEELPIEEDNGRLTFEGIRQFMDQLTVPEPQRGVAWHGVIDGQLVNTVAYTKTTSKVHEIEQPVNGKVHLFETKEKVSFDDVILVNAVRGYFHKNDARLHKDILSNEYIIVHKKYKQYCANYAGVVSEIKSNGELDHSTIKFSTDYQGIQSKYAKVCLANDNAFVRDCDGNLLMDRFFVTKELLENKVFNHYYKESIRTGAFEHKDYIKTSDLEKNKKWLYRKRKMHPFTNFHNYMQNKPTIYNAMLGKKYTYGIEIETSSGLLPERFDDELFYNSVHDGSLRDEEGQVYGGEYVTDVLYSDLGLLQIKKLCNELSKRCQINHRCGVHTHIGGVTFNKENIVLMYHLYQRLEKEIFAMLPKSRRNNEFCRKLKALDFDINKLKGTERAYYIDFYYNNIINLLSQADYCNSEINKKKDHPRGFKCGYDHSSYRYCWVNFIPAVFNTRKNGIYTIEFRPHSATTSYNKIKNWLFICIALVDIVENHKKELYENFNMNLFQLIKTVYPKDHIKINDYIHKRTNKFNDSSLRPEEIEASDYVDNEIDNNLSIKNL